MVTPKNIKQLQEHSRDLQARRVDRHTYVVASASDPTANHIVTINIKDDGRTLEARCTCQWARYQGIACSHVLATLEYMASLKERTLSFWKDEDSARRQKHRLFYLSGRNDDGNEGIWITSRGA